MKQLRYNGCDGDDAGMIKTNKVKRRGTTLTWVGVVEGYRAAPGAPPKQRVIKSFGYLEDQPDQEAFMATVKEYNDTYKSKDTVLKISEPFNRPNVRRR
jgi:hypothetical protein